MLTGAAVRLTGSGLGCPTWPKCYGSYYPPLNTHAVIEFSNRVVSVPVVLLAGAAWVGALRRRPYRRDLMLLGALLPLGVIAQAVLGGFTVKGALDYGWVMGHFALSMLILVAGTALVWRAREDAVLDGATPAAAPSGGARSLGASLQPLLADQHASGPQVRPAADPHAFGSRERPAEDRRLLRPLLGLTAWGALTIFAGTAATAAGPHAGGSPGQRINRLDFDGRGTMDFVIHRHGEIALVFGLAAVGLWWLARKREASAAVQRPLTALCWLLALQGAVGLDQYETHLPTELVWVHVTLACCSWLAALWAACAAGAVAPRRRANAQERRPESAPVGVAPLQFPGN